MEGERERGIGGEVDIRIMYVRFPGFGGGGMEMWGLDFVFSLLLLLWDGLTGGDSC